MEFAQNVLYTLLGMFKEGPLEAAIAAVVLILFVVILLILCYGLLVAFDSWFLPQCKSPGKIISKQFTPAHTTYTFINKTLYPISYPDYWEIEVAFDGQEDSVEVSEDFYNYATEGTSVIAEYVMGRFSGRRYLRDVTIP